MKPAASPGVSKASTVEVVTAALEQKLGEVVAELRQAQMEKDDLEQRLAAALREIEEHRARANSEKDDLERRLTAALREIEGLRARGDSMGDSDDDIELVEEPERVAMLPARLPPSLPSASAPPVLDSITRTARSEPEPAPVVAAPVVSVIPSSPNESPKISVAPIDPAEASLSRVVVSTVPPADEERVSRPSNAGGRRRSERRDCEFEVEFLGDTHFTTGITQDLSEGGVFVATYQRLPLGTPVSMAFELPGQHRVEVRGEVRWVRSEQADAGTRPGLGIAFTDVSAEALARIVEFCGTVPARYYEL